MHSWIRLGTDFGGFYGRKWSQVGSKIEKKMMINWKVLKRKNIGKTNTKIGFLNVRATFFDTKSVEKSFKKRSANWRGLDVIFFTIFSRFWVASWGWKSMKNRYNTCWKKWWKQGCGENGSRSGSWISNTAGGSRSRCSGRSPLLLPGEPLPPLAARLLDGLSCLSCLV